MLHQIAQTWQSLSGLRVLLKYWIAPRRILLTLETNYPTVTVPFEKTRDMGERMVNDLLSRRCLQHHYLKWLEMKSMHLPRL